MGTLRIAFGRIMQESNALSPVRTELVDFEQTVYMEGDAITRACSPGGHEVKGYFKKAELAGFLDAVRADGNVEAIPTIAAWASSNGPLSKACFETLESRLADRLAAAHASAKLDGIYLCLHGAMCVEGVRDAEARLLASAREAAGGAPVVTTHDLHANLTKGRVETPLALVGYHTNPHRDHARCGKLAGELLFRTLRGEIVPTAAWRTLPMILGGGTTIDFLRPMRAVFRRMKAMEKQRGVLTASTFMAHPWNDDPALGWSTYVATDRDPRLAEELADELAEMCWARRHQLPPTFATADEGMAKARAAKVARKTGVVTMSDASDVVSAGAPGDSTHLLKAMLEQGAGMTCYAAVRDPAAIETLWGRSIGDTVELAVGGGLAPAWSSPLPVRGTLTKKSEQFGFQRCAVLQLGELHLVITEGPSMVMRPSFYTNLGLPIMKADIVMVKNFFPFLLFFAPYNRKAIFVRTHGTTDFAAAYQLTFDGPVHPRDEVTEWRSRDRLRRGV